MNSNEEIPLPKVKCWYPRAILYNPLKVGSIDGTDTEPHDRAILRAMEAKYYPNTKVKGIPENTIFIARLNKHIKERHIKEVFASYHRLSNLNDQLNLKVFKEFSKFGNIKNCRLVKDIITGFSLGYAFVEYEKEHEAHRAVNKADGILMGGKKIFVDFECERLLPGWVPRRLGGGFGGRKESGQLRFGGKEKPFMKPIHLMQEWEMKKQYQRHHNYAKPR